MGFKLKSFVTKSAFDKATISENVIMHVINALITNNGFWSIYIGPKYYHYLFV